MEVHDGVVGFRPAQIRGSGRETIMLGRVQVGEISPSVDPRSRFPVCFRLDLPDASSRAWQPARDVADARRQAIGKINDWLDAAGVTPIGSLLGDTASRSSLLIEKTKNEEITRAPRNAVSARQPFALQGRAGPDRPGLASVHGGHGNGETEEVVTRRSGALVDRGEDCRRDRCVDRQATVTASSSAPADRTSHLPEGES